MSQGPLCPNMTKNVQKEVSQIANCNLLCMMLLGGLSVHLNHLKIQNRLSRALQAPPMDRFLMDNLNDKCPLTPHECVKK